MKRPSRQTLYVLILAALLLAIAAAVTRADVTILTHGNPASLPAGVDVVSGHYKATGTPPVLSACGTTPSIIGSDTAGKITVGGGVVASCTVTFAAPFATAPSCVLGQVAGSQEYQVSTTTAAMTVTGSDLTSDVIHYICIEGS